ncbi:M23 family metallopeptidase [uncultured Muribaculum sp.]|uniref:M23 family metallopeptidase n=1 Tax=uncultured Muribaculum sp. TaxID=1918613 RepID=UPI0025E2666F|nr:M23 family metallopeptidase [uncultured Muribaculum sp.]
MCYTFFRRYGRVAVMAAVMAVCASVGTAAPQNKQNKQVEDRLPHLARPLDIPLLLSGNFGELRRNHFHSGLDFKTQGRTGLPVRSADDGWVSRIVVSPWGFGRAVYVMHPSTGLTTVYGHLEAFSPTIDKRVRDEQYARESFSVDMEFMPGEIPVKRGETIGRSGNAGSSGGPHLHMDVRDTRTGDALDPMPYYRGDIKDDTAPEVRAIALYAEEGEGTVAGPAVLVPAKAAQGFTAWGAVIPGIKAYDRMTGTTNIYGVKHLALEVDGNEVYRRTIDRFSFGDTKAVNTLTDYAGVVNNGSWMMWTRIPGSEPLGDMIRTVDRGMIVVDEERDYKCRWILEDEHGNRRVQPFTIHGRKAVIPAARRNGNLIDRRGRNTFNVDGATVIFPKGTFYDDCYVAISASPSDKYVTPVYSVGDAGVPVSGEFSLDIDVPAAALPDSSKLCMVRISPKGRATRVDASYAEGRMCGRPSALGRFAVAIDTVAPKVRPVKPETWGRIGKVKYVISDNLSGVKTYRGTIDGKFALFELDGKTATATFVMDSSRFSKGRKHEAVMTVTDACGNTTVGRHSFTW